MRKMNRNRVQIDWCGWMEAMVARMDYGMGYCQMAKFSDYGIAKYTSIVFVTEDGRLIVSLEAVETNIMNK